MKRMRIQLKDYAARHDRDVTWLRRMAAAGRFQTTEKIGRDWWIDSEEPLPERQKPGAKAATKEGDAK